MLYVLFIYSIFDKLWNLSENNGEEHRKYIGMLFAEWNFKL